MFHRTNRTRLFEKASGGLFVFSAYDTMQLSGDMEAPFLQESSFWWLCGVTEAGWKLILDTSRKHATLVRPHRSNVDIIFNGKSDDDAIIELSGVDEIIPADEFEARLRQLHRKHAVVHTLKESSGHEFVPNPAQRNLSATLARVFDSIQDCTKTILELRAVKDDAEIARLRAAVTVTVSAFKEVRESFDLLKTENQIEAEFTYRFRKSNAHHAYAPIVAGGARATTLHYIRNDAKVSARDMVLIDIGARVSGYSADITRTYCRNPTKRQRAVHKAVAEAHLAIIDLIAPHLSVQEYITKSDEIMKQALHSVGLLDDIADGVAYRQYFPHAISHGLGVDTHDSLGAPRVFLPGMVITVEPGIYIPEEGIGIRIEDDILVTPNGHENLSGSLSIEL